MPDLRSTLTTATQIGRRVAIESRAFVYARRAGMIGGDPPRQTIEALRASARYGQFGSATTIAAMRHGDQAGLIDELGTLSFNALEERANALACALRARGLRERESLGILCRNH